MKPKHDANGKAQGSLIEISPSLASRTGLRLTVLVCAGLAAAIFVVYAQVAGFAFVTLDDYGYVLKNTAIENGLTVQGIRWAFATFHMANWHPLTWISHMLDIQLFGMNPGMHHLVNVFLHVLNTLLLFLLLKKATGAVWRSAAVAGLFALHPLHVESVAWIAERKDLLSTLFWMLTTLCYVLYVERKGFLRYLLVAVLFAVGLLAKPMLVTLPFTLLLLDLWPLNRLGSVLGGGGAPTAGSI